MNMLFIRIPLVITMYFNAYFNTLFNKLCFDMTWMSYKIMVKDLTVRKKYLTLIVSSFKMLYMYLIAVPDEYAKHCCYGFWNDTKNL